MKRVAALLLLFVLCSTVKAASIVGPKGFDGKLWSSVQALYVTDGERMLVCTAQPFEKIEGGYRLISAGHCVIPDAKYFVAADPAGEKTEVTLIKYRFDADYDFSLLELKTTVDIPVTPLGLDNDLRVGDAVIDPNYTLGLGKQLSTGKISSSILLQSHHCDDTCIGSFLVQLTGGGPGASGSAVISVRTHKIIGLLVQEFEGENAGFVVEPVSRLRAFLAGPGQDPPAPALTIPGDVFQQLFGEEHPFMLTVHGPDPVFTQAGYTFKATIDGLELNDATYYAIPVFIGVDATGYHLVSSNEDHYSVPVVIVSAP